MEAFFRPDSSCSSSEHPPNAAVPGSLGEVLDAFLGLTRTRRGVLSATDGALWSGDVRLEAARVEVGVVDTTGSPGILIAEFRAPDAVRPLDLFSAGGDAYPAAMELLRLSTLADPPEVSRPEHVDRIYEPRDMLLENVRVRALTSGRSWTLVASWHAGLGSVSPYVDREIVARFRAALVPVELERWMTLSVGAHARAAHVMADGRADVLAMFRANEGPTAEILREPPNVWTPLVVSQIRRTGRADEDSIRLATVWIGAAFAHYETEESKWPLRFTPFENSEGHRIQLSEEGSLRAARALSDVLARVFVAATAPDAGWRLPV